ncbi:MAG TPA: universal stress protein [Acidisarcina sp.]|nr:universal stress protein [Acidisarcina sp.]
MTPLTNQRWSVPQTILLATEIPVNDLVFAFALAQAKETKAKLILFHAYDTLVVSASETSGLRYYDYAAAAKTETRHLEPFAEKAQAAGIECEIIVRQGLAPRMIVDCAHEKNADRIVVGTRCPGPIGKILLGSVAEEVLRSSDVPVYVVGPEVVNKAFDGYRIKNVLCATSLGESCFGPVALAAEVALHAGARLLLLHVMKPSESAELLARRTIQQIEEDVKSLIPIELRSQLVIEPMVVLGEPPEEILFQAKSQHVDLMVLGAQEASVVATLTRHGVVYKVLAHAPCPVLTLSPAAMAREARKFEPEHAGATKAS